MSEEEDECKDAEKYPDKTPTEPGAASGSTLPITSLGIADATSSIMVMFNDDGSSSQVRVLPDEF